LVLQKQVYPSSQEERMNIEQKLKDTAHDAKNVVKDTAQDAKNKVK